MASILSFLGRLMLCAMFFLLAVSQIIPRFDAVQAEMARVAIPQPKIVLWVAVGALILGSVSLILGYRARIGAIMLLVFLGVVNYYYHRFWVFPPESEDYRREMFNFLRNFALGGAMVFIIANGPGAGSLDAIRRHR